MSDELQWQPGEPQVNRYETAVGDWRGVVVFEPHGEEDAIPWFWRVEHCCDASADGAEGYEATAEEAIQAAANMLYALATEYEAESQEEGEDT
jgi:hypothetical protein